MRTLLGGENSPTSMFSTRSSQVGRISNAPCCGHSFLWLGQFWDPPQPHRPILPTGQDVLAIGEKHGGVYGAMMPLQLLQLLAGSHVPQLHRAVFSCREHPATVGGEHHRFNEVRMPLESAQLFICCHVPEPNGLVAAGGEDSPTVGRKVGTREIVRVPGEAMQLLS